MPSKHKLAIGTAKAAAKKPGATRKGIRAAVPVVKVAIKAGKPIVRRRARKQFGQATVAARTAADLIAIYGPIVGVALGLVEPPKRRRVAPQLVAGVVIGAGAVYLLGPKRDRTCSL